MLVFVPFGATALALATLSIMFVLEKCRRKHPPLSAQAGVQHGHIQDETRGMSAIALFDQL